MQTNETSQLHDKNAQESLDPPLVPFLEMLNGGDSLTTIRDRQQSGFVQQVVSSGAAPIWMREFKGVVKAVWFNVLPVGWVGDWHPSPSLQWVVSYQGVGTPKHRTVSEPRWVLETFTGARTSVRRQFLWPRPSLGSGWRFALRPTDDSVRICRGSRGHDRQAGLILQHLSRRASSPSLS